MRISCGLVLPIFVILVFDGPLCAEPYRIVAMTGEQAPELPTGVTFRGFRFPVMNEAGRIAFGADLTGTGVNSSNDVAIWIAESDSLVSVVREGDQAPGTPEGVVFRDLDNQDFKLNSSGQLALYSILSGANVTSANDEGIWSGGANSLALFARTGDHAPGMSEDGRFIQLETLYAPQIDSSGRVAILASSNGDGITGPIGSQVHGIWAGRANNLALVVSKYGQAPDMNEEVAIETFYFDSPVLGASGHIAFQVDVSGPGIDGTNREGIWLGDANSQRLLVRTGEPAPGTPPGTRFRHLSNHQVSASGHLAFSAFLNGDDVDDTNNRGIWSNRSGTVELVVREGSDAPGTQPGVKFYDDFGGLKFYQNARGEIAFRAHMSGPNVDDSNALGIWSDARGAIELVARTGSTPPGMWDDAKFYEFDQFILNAAGQTAIVGRMIGPDLDAFNSRGIWAQDSDGVLRLIVRVEDQIEVQPGDVRTISAVNLAGISDTGRIAFGAVFFDGSQGIFTSDLVAIPEPPSLLMLSISLFLCRRRSRTRRQAVS